MDYLYNNSILKNIELDCFLNIKSKNCDLIHFIVKDCSQQDQLDVLLDYIQKYPHKINLQNDKGWTPLMIASINSNTTSSVECVKLLLEKGADPNLSIKDGRTALMYASRYSNTYSNIETVELLLKNDADPNLKDEFGRTALIFACDDLNRNSNLETVKLLLENGADPNLKNVNGETAFTITKNSVCKNLLLEYGAEIDTNKSIFCGIFDNLIK